MGALAAALVLASKLALGIEPVAFEAKVPAPVRAAVLVFDGIDVPGHRSAIVRIFVGLPSANADTPAEDPHYVGEISLVAISARRKKRPAQRVELDVPAQLLRGESLSVTLVPTDAQGRKPAAMEFRLARLELSIE